MKWPHALNRAFCHLEFHTIMNIPRVLRPSRSSPILGSLCLSLWLAPTPSPAVSLADVDPFIGTDAHGHVFPGATVPFGMVQFSPDTRDSGWDGSSGYHYSDDSILGFTMNHLTGTGCGDLGNILIMPCVGPVQLVPGNKPGQGYRARFAHQQEKASPGYYSVALPDEGVTVELTATARAGLARFTFPNSSQAHLIMDLQHGIANPVTDAGLTVENNHTASGFRRSNGWGGDKVYYFVMEFSQPFQSFGVAQADHDLPGAETQGRETKGHFDFQTRSDSPILVRVGLSTVSVEGARRNLHSEIPGWNFDKTARQAGSQWKKALGSIVIQTPDRHLARTCATALYHSLLAPTLLSDVDGQFRGPDGLVHQARGYNYYTEMSLWDIFRAESPLLTLIQPGRVNDFIRTMLDHDQIFGHGTLPVWPEGGKETWCMIGNHAIPIIADAYLKGIRGYDTETALQDMIRSTEQDREQLSEYRTLGYIPTGDHVQSVSKVLEYAYDDSCIARMAEAMGHHDLAEKFFKRSQNWTNVFDPSTGFMRGRNADGSWVTPFGRKEMESINFDEYTEANAWEYNFFVPQDVPGLIARLGGDQPFAARLDELFDTPDTIPNLTLIPDVTGVIGMYSQGNEPDHHVAYLYNAAGMPWKTQTRVRQIATSLYDDSPAGICGNDDCGQMSAWFLFSAMGFYPVDPVSEVYVLGSPLVNKVVLHPDPRFYHGRSFTMIARDNSPSHPYIQSATLNGRPLTHSWISQADIVSGGTLELVMGAQPNKQFGLTTQDRPPGMRNP